MSYSSSMPNSILCVCLGNICRSPTAEAVFRQKLAIAGLSIRVDSAGMSNAHMGEHPDIRSQKHAKLRGYKLAKLAARQVVDTDFLDFDLILAMDKDNLSDLQAIKNRLLTSYAADELATLELFSHEDPNYCQKSVPDPYYGKEDTFELVLDQIESNVDAWIYSWKR